MNHLYLAYTFQVLLPNMNYNLVQALNLCVPALVCVCVSSKLEVAMVFMVGALLKLKEIR